MLYDLQVIIITGEFTLCMHPRSLLREVLVNKFSKKVIITKLFADPYIYLRGLNEQEGYLPCVQTCSFVFENLE